VSTTACAAPALKILSIIKYLLEIFPWKHRRQRLHGIHFLSELGFDLLHRGEQRCDPDRHVVEILVGNLEVHGGCKEFHLVARQLHACTVCLRVIERSGWRRCHGVARSYACATRNTALSSNGFAPIWSETGSPALVYPIGNAMAGMFAMLKG